MAAGAGTQPGRKGSHPFAFPPANPAEILPLCSSHPLPEHKAQANLQESSLTQGGSPSLGSPGAPEAPGDRRTHWLRINPTTTLFAPSCQGFF